MKITALLFFLFLFKNSYPQVNTDSLQSALKAKPAEPQVIKNSLYSAFKMSNSNEEAKLIIYNWAIAKSAQTNYPEGMAMAYRFLGLYYRDMYDNAAATENMLKAIDIAEKNRLYQLEAQSYDGLSGIYDMANAYPRAIEYQRKAIEVYEKTNNKKGLGSLYHNLGLLLHDSVDQSRKGTNNPEILTYFRTAIKISEETNDSIVLLQVLNGAARIYSESKIFDSAALCLDRAEALIKKLNVPRFYSSHFLYRGSLYRKEGNYAKAIETYQIGLQTAVNNKDPFYQSLYYDNISKAYSLAGDSASAYKYHLLYSDLNDSLMSEEKLQITATLDGKFQKEKKEKEITRLTLEQHLKQLQLEKQKAIIANNLLEAQKKENEITLLSQQKELQDLRIIQQDENLEKNLLQAKADSQQITLSNQQLLLSNQQKEIKEKELGDQKKIRNYLLAGLGVLGLLSFFLLKNISARKKAYKLLEDKSIQIKEQALQLSKQARLIAQFQSQMNPHFVYNALHNIQGLVLTHETQKANTQIQSLAQLMRKTFANAEKDDIPVEEEINYLHKYIDFEKVALDNKLDFDVTVNKNAENTLIPPMMIQPFVENAIKHAELKKIANPYIRVLIEIENNLLAISIKDNGTGIKKKPDETDKLSHSVSVIKSRLNLLFKGKADVNNQPVFSIKTIPEVAEGTAVKFYLPLQYSY